MQVVLPAQRPIEQKQIVWSFVNGAWRKMFNWAAAASDHLQEIWVILTACRGYQITTAQQGDSSTYAVCCEWKGESNMPAV